jgi:hypothetical protein
MAGFTLSSGINGIFAMGRVWRWSRAKGLT